MAVERDVCGVFEAVVRPFRAAAINASLRALTVDADITSDHRHHTVWRAARSARQAPPPWPWSGAVGGAGAADEMALNDSHLHPGAGWRNARCILAGPMMIASKSHDKPLQRRAATLATQSLISFMCQHDRLARGAAQQRQRSRAASKGKPAGDQRLPSLAVDWVRR